MDAVLVLRERLQISDTVYVEMVVWQVPKALKGSNHAFKYRLALISGGICVLRFDNAAGKGDHKHVGNREVPYTFGSVDDLLVDFWTEVDTWLKRR